MQSLEDSRGVTPAEVLARVACCPDDGGSFVPTDDGVVCSSCNRARLPNVNGVFDLRPATTFEKLTGGYLPEYVSLATSSTDASESTLPFGVNEAESAVWAERKRRHVALGYSQLLAAGATASSIVCDFSGGAGYYTLEYAKKFSHVIHCDLDPASLAWTAARARQAGIRNVVFVRMDYFQPPFVQTLDYVICFDTLIRGLDHERALLDRIRRSLSAGGCAILDFHNWWHNPARRLGLLPQNFGANRSYSLAECSGVLQDAGLHTEGCVPFRQENMKGPMAWIQPLIPPTRFVFRVRP